MKVRDFLLLTFLLLAGAFCASRAHPQDTPKRLPVGLWVQSETLLVDQTDYAALGFDELVVLLPDKGRSLYDGSLTKAAALATVQRLKARAQGLKLAVSTWCYNEIAANDLTFDRRQLGIWTKKQWLTVKGPLGALTEACRDEGVGFAVDGEAYALTAGGNGGLMGVHAAWTAPGLKDRAKEFQTLCKGLSWTVVYVHSNELGRLDGLDDWFQGTTKLQLWDEATFYNGSYTSKVRGRASGIGATGAAGYWPPPLASMKAADLRGVVLDRISRAGRVWWYDPGGEVRKYPDLVKRAIRP